MPGVKSRFNWMEVKGPVNEEREVNLHAVWKFWRVNTRRGCIRMDLSSQRMGSQGIATNDKVEKECSSETHTFSPPWAFQLTILVIWHARKYFWRSGRLIPPFPVGNVRREYLMRGCKLLQRMAKQLRWQGRKGEGESGWSAASITGHGSIYIFYWPNQEILNESHVFRSFWIDSRSLQKFLVESSEMQTRIIFPT